MSNLDELESIFEDPSDIKMEDLPKPNCTLQLKPSLQSLKSIQSTDVSSAPSWHSLLFLSLHPWHLLWFPALIELYCHCSYYSYQPILSSMSMTPETISFGRGHHSSMKGNTLCQGISKRS